VNTSNIAYEKDFYAWVQHNLNLLKQGKLADIDVANLPLSSFPDSCPYTLVQVLDDSFYPK